MRGSLEARFASHFFAFLLRERTGETDSSALGLRMMGSKGGTVGASGKPRPAPAKTFPLAGKVARRAGWGDPDPVWPTLHPLSPASPDSSPVKGEL